MNIGKCQNIEENTDFTPRFNPEGLIPCITTSAGTGVVLMFAWMNREALERTIETGEAYYWSRSRNQLWHKGATSGFVQKVKSLRTDCDQDCLWISVEVEGIETACHTGRSSCFYREVPLKGGAKPPQLRFIEPKKS